MAIAFRAVGTTSKVASGNMSPGLPAGHVTNDILLLFTNQQDNVVCSVSGYTNIANGTANNGTNDRISVWAKRDNGAEAAPNVVHTAGGISNAVIAAFSGVDSGLAIGTGAGTILRDVQNQTGSSTTTFTAPALSGVISGDMRIFFGGFTANDTSGTTTNNWGTVSTFTERLDDCSDLTGAWGVSLGIDTLLAAGSAGSITSAVGWTGAFTSWTWICAQLALSSDAAGTSVALTGVSRAASVGTVGLEIPVGPLAFQADAFQNDAFQVASTTTVALTGVTATASVGLVAPTFTIAAAGNTATASVGTLAVSTAVTTSGVSATSAVGTLTPSTTVATTGVASTTAVGSVTPSRTVTVTGVSASGAAGSLVPSATVSVTGTAAAGAVGTVTATTGVVLSLTGVQAVGSIGALATSIVISGFLEITIADGGAFATQSVASGGTFVAQASPGGTDYVEIDTPHGGPFS